MKKRLCQILIPMLFFVNIFLLVNHPAEALTTKVEKNTGNMGTYKTFYEDENRNTYSYSIVRVTEPADNTYRVVNDKDGMYGIEEIKIKVRRIGSSSTDVMKVYSSRHHLGIYDRDDDHYYWRDDDYSRSYKQKLLKSITLKDNSWHEFTLYDDPSYGRDEIMFCNDNPYDEEPDTYFEVEVLNIKYYDYNGTYTIYPKVNLDTKRVEFYIESKEKLCDFYAVFENITNNSYLNYVSSSSTETVLPGTQLLQIDDTVVSDKYYDYEVEYGFIAHKRTSSYDYSLGQHYLSLGIFVPTDAGLAREAAEEARDMLNGSSNGGKSLAATYDAVAYIRDTQLPDLENKINDIETNINNIKTTIQNTDDTPPTVDVQTVSGARATSASSIAAIVTVSDNKPGPFTYAVNDGEYKTLPDDGRISLPVSYSGNNSITVKVKDAAGNVGSKTIIIRKL